MKIVFLNVLHAEMTTPLRAFLLQHRDTTDVFCFQEADGAMDALIQEALPGYAPISASKPEPDQPYTFNNLTLVHSSHAIEASHSNEASTDLGLALYASVRYKGALVHIANVHGITKPGKLDLPARLRQSQEIVSAMEALQGVHVVGGDFNVLPETQSLQMFRDAGYADLISDYSIKTTRNPTAWEKYPGHELYHSDYVFIKGAAVTSFVVPPPEFVVSDHQPLIVTIAP